MAEGSTLEVAVVSAERLLWQGEAKSVVAKTPEGEIGILPGHEPVLALLLESPLRIEGPDGNKMMVAVHGGFFSVDSNKVNVIAEVAELAEDIDLERAQAALSRAQAAGDDSEEPSALKRAETRITVAGTAKGLSKATSPNRWLLPPCDPRLQERAPGCHSTSSPALAMRARMNSRSLSRFRYVAVREFMPPW